PVQPGTEQFVVERLVRLHRKRELGARDGAIRERADVDRRLVVLELGSVGEPRQLLRRVELHHLALDEFGRHRAGEARDVDLGLVAPVVAGDHARQHAGVDLARARRDQGEARARERLFLQPAQDREMRVSRADQQDALHALRFASSLLRSSLRCTLPVVVMGSASMNSISRGYSYGASRPRTCCWIFSTSSWPAENPGCSTTNALTIVPRVSSGLPITAALATAGCFTRQLSISAGPMR